MSGRCTSTASPGRGAGSPAGTSTIDVCMCGGSSSAQAPAGEVERAAAVGERVHAVGGPGADHHERPSAGTTRWR